MSKKGNPSAGTSTSKPAANPADGPTEAPRHPLRVRLRRHVPALDGVRGIAILTVVIYHSNVLHYPATTGEHLWRGIVLAGWFGVDLFFVLSGFLITGILFEAKGKPGYFRAFWLRRILRIFPLYYLFLVFSFYVAPSAAEALNNRHLIMDLENAAPGWFWAYLPNFLFAKAEAFVGPRHLHATWSLGIEEQFYLVWPVVVFFLRRRALLVVCGAGVVLALVLRLVLYADGTHWIAIFVLPFTRMDCLLIGAFASIWLRREEGVDEKSLRFWSGLLFAAGMGVVVLYAASHEYLGQDQPLVHTVGFTLLAMMFLALLIGSVVSKPGGLWARLIEMRWLQFLGKYSYGLYLTHPVVQYIVHEHVLDSKALYYQLWESRVAVQVVFTVVSTSGSVLFAYVLYHAFERHFLGLKKYFPMPTVTTPVPDAGTGGERRDRSKS